MVSLRDQDEIKIFLDELEENLSFLDDSIIALEEHPDNAETLEDIFRVAHTIKGSASFLDLENLVSLGHSMENVFQEFKTGSIKVNKEVIDTLLACKDAIGKIGNLLGHGEDTRKIQTQGLIDKINSFLKNKKDTAGKRIDHKQPIPEAMHELGSNDYIPGTMLVRVWISQAELAPSIRAFLVHKRLGNLGEIVKQSPSEEEMDSDDFTISKDREIRYWIKTAHPPDEVGIAAKVDLIDKVGIISENVLKELSNNPGTGKEDESAKNQKSDVETSDSVRIPVHRLDVMLNLVGELVIANSGFLQISETLRLYPDLQNIFKDVRDRTKDLVRISSEIQGLVMNSRLVPISSVFNRFRRFVRDYASKSGKKVVLSMTGESTELDKKITDELIKPLTHLVRNSLDHGVELPSDRINVGKPETATLHLEAYQEGNYINIIIRDDGRGLNFDKIAQKAVERGLISPEASMSLSSDDIKALVFQAGFSTKDEVDEMSGRGVGMDVVKKSVEDLNGTIILDSEKDQGTVITIKLPLTLAILNALIVKVGSERYCIPMASIVETQKVSSKNFLTVDSNEMVRLRDKLIPVIRLDKIFPSPAAEHTPAPSQSATQKAFTKKHLEIASDEHPVIVVDYHTTSIAILVDQFLSRQEVVIKSLAEHYRAIDGISGASILGDGSIILIIDVHGVIQIYRSQKGKSLTEISAAPGGKKSDLKPIPITSAVKKPAVETKTPTPVKTPPKEIAKPQPKLVSPAPAMIAKEIKLDDISKMTPSEFEQLEDFEVKIKPVRRDSEETESEMATDENIDIFPDTETPGNMRGISKEFEPQSESMEIAPEESPKQVTLENIEIPQHMDDPAVLENMETALDEHEEVTLENIEIPSHEQIQIAASGESESAQFESTESAADENESIEVIMDMDTQPEVKPATIEDTPEKPETTEIQNLDFTEDDLNDIDIAESSSMEKSDRSHEELIDEETLDIEFKSPEDDTSDTSIPQGEEEVSLFESKTEDTPITDETSGDNAEFKDEENFEFTVASDDSISLKDSGSTMTEEQRLEDQTGQELNIEDESSSLAVSPSSDISIEEIEKEMMEMENLESQRDKNGQTDSGAEKKETQPELSEFQKMKMMIESEEDLESDDETSIALGHFDKNDFQMDKLYDLLDGKNPEMVKTWLKTGNEKAIDGIKSLTGHQNIFPGQTKAKRYSKDKLVSYINRFKEDDSPIIGLTLPMLPIKGMIYFILNQNNARNMAEMLYQAAQMPAPETIDFEPLMEVTNILGSAFTNSLTQLTGIPVEPGIPQILENNEILVESMEENLNHPDDSSILYIENEFMWGEKEVLAELIMMIPKIL
ncbi:MAG: chemotaxis protein CheW [Spirochaetia bacterium]|nr:chemotaxis protein CheW [Spirochaetia bacterium]